MKRLLVPLVLPLLLLLCVPSSDTYAQLSPADKKIVDQIINTCREIYKRKRPCPCPYDFTKGNELCSTNSAYDKAKGPTPFCERADVKPEEIAAVKQMNESFITTRCTPK